MFHGASVPTRLMQRHEVAVRHRVRRLLELPQVLREAGDRRRRVEDDLGAVQAEQRARPRGSGGRSRCTRRPSRTGLEHRVAEVAGLEEVLLPEPGGMRDVVLAVLAEVACRRRRTRLRCCSRRPPARARRPGTTIAIWYFFAYVAISSVVGPGTGSATSYQCASCDGQKYGPLKTSCRPRICTPLRPASSMSGMCTSIAAWRTVSMGAAGSVSGVAACIRPPISCRGMNPRAKSSPTPQAKADYSAI